jgi:hypothetical protein
MKTLSSEQGFGAETTQLRTTRDPEQREIPNSANGALFSPFVVALFGISRSSEFSALREFALLGISRSFGISRRSTLRPFKRRA